MPGSADLAEPKKSFAKCFARYVLELAQLMTVNDVARHLAISSELIRGIVGVDLQRRIGRPKLEHLKQIAIDDTNKIKLLQRQAFGYRGTEFFKLRLLGLGRSQHAFVG